MAGSAFPVTALVLAAGLSRRMGRFKLLMPWGASTVIGQVAATLAQAGVPDIAIITGRCAADVERVLAGTAVRFIFNPRFAEGEMIGSIGAGLAALEGGNAGAALLCLGDQPQLRVDTVRAVVEAGAAAGWERVVIPSYQMRAGHPILLPRWLWPEVMATDRHLNAVLKAHRDETAYVTVDTPGILSDIDTPEDYAEAHNNGFDNPVDS